MVDASRGHLACGVGLNDNVVGRASVRVYPSGRPIPCTLIGSKQTTGVWPP